MGQIQSQSSNNTHEEGYYVRVMSRTIRVATSQVVHSGPYKISRQSFVFARRFTVTKTLKNSLNQQGQFGKILMILIVPITILLDLVILLGGICAGSGLLCIIMIFFIFYIFFLLLKSIVTNS